MRQGTKVVVVSKVDQFVCPVCSAVIALCVFIRLVIAKKANIDSVITNLLLESGSSVIPKKVYSIICL